MTPENTLPKSAIASAPPSASPIQNAPAFKVCAMNKGKSAWIISDEMSINRLTIPSTHTVRGTAGFFSVVMSSSLIVRLLFSGARA